MAKRTVECLLADVQFALDRGLSARDLVPMLRDLWSKAPAGSDASRFARLELGRLLLETEPFRAASLIRSVVREHATDEGYGLLGVALSLLGHFRAAAKAHRQACQLAPRHPAHAHNLGHLLDAAFGKPSQAIPWLKRAFLHAPDVPGIATSYAHALAQVGKVTEARRLLRRFGRLEPDLVESTLQEWLLPPKERSRSG